MAVPENTGYPLKWFKQQEHVRDLYECTICLEVVKDVVQVRNCGHQFCQYCLDGVLRCNSTSRCPNCQISISSEMIFKDHAAVRAVGKLDVQCPESGCKWNGNLNSFLKEHPEVCPFLVLDCTNAGCKEQVIRKNLPAHLTGCEYRTVTCQHCSNEHVFKDKAEHLETCPLVPVKCTCSERIPRNQMEKHVENVCSRTVVKCSYSKFGCDYECQRRYLEKHLVQGVKDHLDLSTLQISTLEDKYEQEIKKLKEKVNTVTHLMIIKDFNKKLLQAKESNSLGRIDSGPFYSSTYGYKMNLNVQLNETGDNMGVYLHIMKSDHDAILSWPFNKKFTFTLIDQQEDEEERENIVKAVIPNGEGYFARPLLSGNAGCGPAKFVSQETLQTRKYVKDNTVFIKLSIET